MNEKITIEEAMQILKRSNSVVRGYIKSQKLSGEIGDDGRYYLLRSEVEAFKRNPTRFRVGKAPMQQDRLVQQLSELQTYLSVLNNRMEELENEINLLKETPQSQNWPHQISENMSVETSAYDEMVVKEKPQKRTTTRNLSIYAQNPLPDGAILASHFAEAHGVHETTFRRQCKHGFGQGPQRDMPPVSSRQKPGKPHEIEYYVLPDQIQQVFDYWTRHNVKFL